MQSGPRANSHTGIPPVWFWAAAYFAALMFIAPAPDIRHADDYHFLEAALQMAQGGPLLGPETPDGQPRLLKPVFGHWPVALGFRALGYSMWSARLPGVLAGALTVWLIGWLGGRLAGRDEGRFAAMMTAASLPLLLAGLRTNPDVWLVLFCTLAAGGFLLRLGGMRSRLALWIGWTGIGLGVATKGMAALLVLPPVYLASLAVHRDAWRRLVHWPAVTACALLGLCWYLAMAIQLGPGVLAQFAHDQMQAKVDGVQVARQAGAHLVFMPLALLPFTLLAVGLHRDDWREALASRGARLVAVYACAYALTLVLVFAFAYQYSGARFVLPALPWLALLLALPLARALPQGRPGRWKRGLVLAALALLCLAAWFGAGALMAALGLYERDAAGSLARALAVTAVIVAVVAGTRANATGALVIKAALVLLLLPMLYGLLRPALPASAGAIVSAASDAPGPVIMADRGSLAGVVRVMSGGAIDTTRELNPPAPGEFGTLVLPESALAPDRYADCEVSEIATGYARIDFDELLAALRAGEGADFERRHRQPYVMVTCPATAAE